MNVIKGKAVSALCFALQVPESARRDIAALCDHEVLRGRKIRIMPDVHSNGDGTVTGFTMTGGEPEIMALEYDAGCGVSCACLDVRADQIDFSRLDAACREIPAGRGQLLIEPAYHYDFSSLHCYQGISRYLEWPVCLGGLGGGNHFIELDRDDDGRVYLVVHNGLGVLSKKAVRYYQNMALAQAGKTPETAVMDDMLLYGSDREAYLHDMHVFEDLCCVNRAYITGLVTGRMGWKVIDSFDTCHHFTSERDGIIRHGAVSAHKGERVIIPVNAKEGCILGTGKGNPEWNYSAPHGGGRLLSRTAAMNELSMDQYREEMKDVYSTTVCEGNLDEAPSAYRCMKEIEEAVRDTVEIEKMIRPVYSYKGI